MVTVFISSFLKFGGEQNEFKCLKSRTSLKDLFFFGTHINGETHKGIDSHISTCPFNSSLNNSVLIKLSSLSENCLFGNSNPGISPFKGNFYTIFNSVINM